MGRRRARPSDSGGRGGDVDVDTVLNISFLSLMLDPSFFFLPSFSFYCRNIAGIRSDTLAYLYEIQVELRILTEE